MLEAGRPLEAREALEDVLRARPNFVDAEAALGLAHFLSGDGVGARDVWQRLPGAPARECAGRGLPGDAGTHRRVRAGWAARAGVASLLAAGLAAACGRRRPRAARATEPTRDGRYAEALTEYRTLLAGRPTRSALGQGRCRGAPRERAARGDGGLPAAGRHDPTRADEAAEGLEGGGARGGAGRQRRRAPRGGHRAPGGGSGARHRALRAHPGAPTRSGHRRAGDAASGRARGRDGA